jgi:hypothetical protein
MRNYRRDTAESIWADHPARIGRVVEIRFMVEGSLELIWRTLVEQPRPPGSRDAAPDLAVDGPSRSSMD